MKRPTLVLALGLLLPGLIGGGCGSGAAQEANDLNNMRTARISIGEKEFFVWVAETDEQRARGLMFVQSEQMGPLEDGTQRGMLFVFQREQRLSFWMKDTVIPLDIAYARGDGTIVKTHTMAPLDTSLGKYSSVEPARFALEVNANLFAQDGIGPGDVINIPQDVLHPPG